jgi:hypothetical protein
VTLGLPLFVLWCLSQALEWFFSHLVKNPSRLRILEPWRAGLSWPLIFVLALAAHLLGLSILGLPLGFRIVHVRLVLVLLVISMTWLFRRILKLSFEHAGSLMERRHESDTESLLLLRKRVLGLLLTCWRFSWF